MTTNRQQPNRDTPNGFRPLTGERINKDESVNEPTSWFTRIAPQLPHDVPAVPRVRIETAYGVVGSTATFQPVEDIAREERRLLGLDDEIPVEILQMRDDAAREASEIIAQAAAQSRILEEEARERGYREGYDAGYTDGAREAHRVGQQQAADDRDTWRQDIEMFVGYIETERRRCWTEIEPQVIGLVFDLAQKVIKQEVEASRTVALSVIKNAMRRITESGNLRIRVNASDLDTVRGSREDLIAMLDGVQHIEIVEDRRVGPGGAVVETPAGNIDARIETQLQEAAKTLEQRVERPVENTADAALNETQGD